MLFKNKEKKSNFFIWGRQGLSLALRISVCNEKLGFT